MFRISKNQVIWGGNFFTECLPSSQGWIVWDKQRPDGITFSDCELAFTSFNVGLRIFRFMWNGMLQGNMKNKEQKCHPCQKPVALYKWILSRYAKPGDKIFDPYLGSGSSRIAAWDMGYKRVVTYTLKSEPGASLRASGFTDCGEAGGYPGTSPPAHVRSSRQPCSARYENTRRKSKSDGKSDFRRKPT